MLRVIFDTNIYGELVEEPNLTIYEEKLKSKYIIYNFFPIRKELRKISVSSIRGRKTRIAVLELLDRLSKNHEIEHSEKIEKISKKYYQVYVNKGGITPWRFIKIGFEIIACASIHNLDVVFSNDRKTMFSLKAIKSYEEINNNFQLKTPKLLIYEDLMNQIKTHFS
ncbi:MAG: hypothetical protein QF632_05580 [Candidatus Woesearchaeota archaeon]|jgi:hypothetical protein|nr:hypothetical protein [Candidatus Woesearchaeota archaeon]